MSFANTDVETSPFSSAKGALRPSLLASRMNVMSRFGILTISDDHASLTTPNVQTTRWPSTF